MIGHAWANKRKMTWYFILDNLSSLIQYFYRLFCHQYSLLQTVVEACQKKQQCKFSTKPKPGLVVPCPATRKYVEVAYKCRPSKYNAHASFPTGYAEVFHSWKYEGIFTRIFFGPINVRGGNLIAGPGYASFWDERGSWRCFASPEYVR